MGSKRRTRRNPPLRWGVDAFSLGPLKSVRDVERVAERLEAIGNPAAQQRAAFARRNPEAILAQPERQRELMDFLTRYEGTTSDRSRRTRQNPPVVVVGVNPPACATRGAVLLGRPVSIRYVHKSRGKRQHDFRFDRRTKIELLPDGSVRIYNPSVRLWNDLPGT